MHLRVRSTTTTRLALAMVLASLGSISVTTLAADEPPLEDRAHAAFTSANWPEARDLYLELSRAESGDAGVWFRLGLATLNSKGSPKAAIAAYEKAIELGFQSAPAALLGIARAHAMDSNKKGVFQTLDRLVELGPSRGAVTQLESNPAFESLRSNPKFAAALEQLTPCRAEAYRQFDFWLGDWEVRTPQDQVVGKNSVTSSLDGCMLIENWESVSAGKGLSINYYDNRDQSWTQTYRDNTGNIGQWPNLVGTFRDGAMRLESPTDAQPRSRWTWTKITEDKVRQMAETSSDGGETWTVVWDSYYIRVGD